MTFENLSIFLTILAVYTMGLVSPGPDFALVLRNALWKRSDRAWPTALGIALGVAVHLTLVTVLLLAGSRNSQGLLTAATALGGVYLAYLGVQTLWGEWRASQSEPQESSRLIMGSTAWDFFRQGLWTNLFNPKAAAFFWSILMGVKLSEQGLALHLALVGLMVTMTLLWFGWLGRVLGRPAVQSVLQKIRRPITVLMGLLLLGYSGLLLSKLLA